MKPEICLKQAGMSWSAVVLLEEGSIMEKGWRGDE
jgi:hypothetical protein